MKHVVFKDQVQLQVRSGKGGDGVASFRREKFIPHGGPDGGDGGYGGNVILKGNSNEDSLLSLYYQPHQRAEHGQDGHGQRKHGRSGKDKVIQVPCGTVVRDMETEEVLGEVIEHEQELVVARGGKGGVGNVHFKSSTNQTPRKCTQGEPVEERTLQLELKLIADIGLVGYPNAGKSTLLSCLTGAHPKIGAYPFTTLNPIIGTIFFDDYRTLRVADIPGLIDGAHEGVGLGDTFLRHIERSRFLIFVIDMAGTDGRDPIEDYRGLSRELRLFSEDLAYRHKIIVANKMDEEASTHNLERFKRETGEDPLLISAQEPRGIENLLQILHGRFFEGSTPGAI